MKRDAGVEIQKHLRAIEKCLDKDYILTLICRKTSDSTCESDIILTKDDLDEALRSFEYLKEQELFDIR